MSRSGSVVQRGPASADSKMYRNDNGGTKNNYDLQVVHVLVVEMQVSPNVTREYA